MPLPLLQELAPAPGPEETDLGGWRRLRGVGQTGYTVPPVIGLPVPVKLRSALLGLAMATALGGSLPPALQAADLTGALAQVPAQASAPSAAEITKAANRVLEALRSGDANARYALFADALKRTSSPSMVANTMKTQPKVLSYRILRVLPGLSNSVVEATLNTTAGSRDVVLVLNNAGQLAGFQYDNADQLSTDVVNRFIQALIKGQFVSARSFLSLAMQDELTPSALQAKWQRLQRVTGDVIKVRHLLLADSAPNQKLVIVSMDFQRLTDSLFVILNDKNEITGVDFPNEAAKPAAAR